MKSKFAYVRFLELIQTIEGRGGLSDMDLDAKKLLEVIVVSDARGNTLTVTDTMQMSAIASPATIHRKLDTLRQMGLIANEYEGENRRTKYLKPTTAALKYFDQVGSMMAKVLKTTG